MGNFRSKKIEVFIPGIQPEVWILGQPYSVGKLVSIFVARETGELFAGLKFINDEKLETNVSYKGIPFIVTEEYNSVGDTHKWGSEQNFLKNEQPF